MDDATSRDSYGQSDVTTRESLANRESLGEVPREDGDEDEVEAAWVSTLELGGDLGVGGVVGYYVTTRCGDTVVGCCVRRFREFRTLKKSLEGGPSSSLVSSLAFPHRTLTTLAGSALLDRLEALRGWMQNVSLQRDALDERSLGTLSEFLGIRPQRRLTVTGVTESGAPLPPPATPPRPVLKVAQDSPASLISTDEALEARCASLVLISEERERQLEALRRRHKAESAALEAATTAEKRAKEQLELAEREKDRERAEHAAQLCALQESLDEVRRQNSVAEKGWSHATARCSEVEQELSFLRAQPPPPPPARGKKNVFRCFGA